MNNKEKINTNESVNGVTVSELSKIWNMPLDETISHICNCDLLYGYICEYHLNPNIKKPLNKWQDLVDDATLYYESNKFPVRKKNNKVS